MAYWLAKLAAPAIALCIQSLSPYSSHNEMRERIFTETGEAIAPLHGDRAFAELIPESRVHVDEMYA